LIFDKSPFDANCVEGAFWDGAGWAWPMPGNNNIKGEKAGVAEIPAHPPQIRGTTNANSKHFALEPTLTIGSIGDRPRLATFISCEGNPYKT
jgi:hypothetical protein